MNILGREVFTEDIFQEIIRIRTQGEKAALVTIISIEGPGPREVGAKMLVRSDGSVMGSIGGGSLEAEVCREAIEVIAESQQKILQFELHGEGVEKALDTGFMSGGNYQIFIEPILPG